MTRWEYRFVELFHRQDYRNHEPPVERATHQVSDDLAAAGRDGWEAVGEVKIEAGGILHPVILLKRPIVDDEAGDLDDDRDD